MFKQATWPCTFLVAILPVCAHSASHAYAIEPTHTIVSFEVSNLGAITRRGVFSDVTGEVSLDPQAGNGSMEILVKARSLHTDDSTTQAFVLGKSFLDVKQYSEIAYRADRIVFADGRPFRIEGKLTLLGVTKDVSLLVSGYECRDEQNPEGGHCVLDAAATFRRSEFGMNHYLTFVSDNVRLAIHGVATEAPLKLAQAP